jgi:hypothetical protein
MRQILLRKYLDWAAILFAFFILAIILRSQGRLWFCECGRIFLWVGDAWSSDTSQHLFDPYSFTHVLHGFVFCWLITFVFSGLKIERQLLLAVVLESIWEILENSSFIIERYRETTAALGYFGDSIINSLGDVFACGIGFLFARSLGFTRSLIIFLLIEAVLIFWIRDSLLLNVLMLLYPIDAVRQWQTGH